MRVIAAVAALIGIVAVWNGAVANVVPSGGRNYETNAGFVGHSSFIEIINPGNYPKRDVPVVLNGNGRNPERHWNIWHHVNALKLAVVSAWPLGNNWQSAVVYPVGNIDAGMNCGRRSTIDDGEIYRLRIMDWQNAVKTNLRPVCRLHFFKLALHYELLAIHGAELQNSGDKQSRREEADNLSPNGNIPVKVIFGWLGVLGGYACSVSGVWWFCFWCDRRAYWIFGTLSFASAIVLVWKSAALLDVN